MRVLMSVRPSHVDVRDKFIKVATVTNGEANKRVKELIDMVQKLADEAWDTKRKELTV